MSDSLNRKACDRCHAQKLSCKRIGDGICERCLRLNAECKSSPSLRYKKQLQQCGQMPEQQQQLPPPPPPPPPLQRPPKQHHQLLHGQRFQDLSHEQSSSPQTNYSQGHIVEDALPVQQGQQIQHLGLEDGTDAPSPKRRRTGSESHLVQREAAIPILATDATMNPALQAHLIPEADASLGLADFAMNMRNINYLAMSQPPMTSDHLLPTQIPPGIESCFSFHQPVPELWDSQHRETQQQHHHHSGPPQPQQQQGFTPSTVSPLVVPEFGAANHHTFYIDQHQHHPTTVSASGGRIPPAVQLVHHIPKPRNHKRRSRINQTSIALSMPNISTFTQTQGPPTGDTAEQRLWNIYNHIRQLSAQLQGIEKDDTYCSGPNATPNEFTISDLYQNTHFVVIMLEHGVKSRQDPNGGANAVPESPLDPSDPAGSLLTLSLYAQLLEIFKRVFTVARSLLAQADAKADDTFPPWLLPPMSIGSAAIGTHPALHMSLTVQLGQQFVSRLQDAFVDLGLVKPGGANEHATNEHATNGTGAEDAVNRCIKTITANEIDLRDMLSDLNSKLNEFMDRMDKFDEEAGEAEA